MVGETRYAAFISYAHADEAVAARLHKALETYPIPKNLEADHHALSPIFRDTAELTAHHSLSEKIRDAVDQSKFLIVLCSPAAKASHWVNEEIRLFRTLHGEASILCVLSEGTPDTSFPAALLEAGREPLAANLGSSRESFKLGVTQLAASMLGVGLDQLIQRETKRRRNRLRLITTGSMAFAALMGGMAWTAINARDAAETSRTEAEKMVEFMLTDLKQDLEPIGKLDVLDDVGKRAADYYDAIPLSDMDDDRLARQARARHLLGQVAMDQGKMDKARSEIETAYQATQEVLRRNPDNTDAIFAHAQSAYWVGEMANISKDYEVTLTNWQEYERLGTKLHKIDPKNLDWVMEAAWGQNNLGTHRLAWKENTEALVHFKSAIELFKAALEVRPEDTNIYFELANAWDGASRSAEHVGDKEVAKKYRLEQIQIFKKLSTLDPNNYPVRFRKARAMAFYFARLETDKEKRAAGLLQIENELQNLIQYDPENATWNQAYEDIKLLIKPKE